MKMNRPDAHRVHANKQSKNCVGQYVAGKISYTVHEKVKLLAAFLSLVSTESGQ